VARHIDLRNISEYMHINIVILVAFCDKSANCGTQKIALSEIVVDKCFIAVLCKHRMIYVNDVC